MNNISNEDFNQKKKFTISNQIGGKGTLRRKGIKKKSSLVEKKKNIDSLYKNINNSITEINKKILKLNNDNYIKFRDFIDELITDYLKDLKRDDIDKSSGLKYSEINKLGCSFIYKNFFYPVDDTKILIKSDLYNFINSSFKESGKKLFLKFIQSIDNILIKKEYDINLDSEKYNKKEFDIGLNYFEFDTKKKIHFKDIRNKYIEFLNNKDNYENTTIYYTLLRNQYSDYIKNFVP